MNAHQPTQEEERRKAKAMRLRYARKEAGYTKATAAAEAMGVTVSTYLGYENGTREYGDMVAKAYANFFGVNPAWLILGEASSKAADEYNPARKRGEVNANGGARNFTVPEGNAEIPFAADIGFTHKKIHEARLSELREQIEEVSDLLHALDKIGDGIGGKDGYAVSAVASNAKAIAESALDRVRTMESATPPSGPDRRE